ncbi:hypothetical protein ACIF85_42235 [Streptomyces sp. NPDC086033]|uniref:hypothetical protein n=1 Tax=Streptomyces sp. NPDC086033 TaxID=3365747 RepID=UPI0037CE6ED2
MRGRAGEFRKIVKKQLARALAGTGVLKALRTQTFLLWVQKLATVARTTTWPS